MKFLSLALASLAGLSTEARKLNASDLNYRMKNGLVNKSVLLKGAKPYNKAAVRKLEEEDAFEITGKYSIQFNSCISMTVQNEDLMADANLVEMAANGDLISEKDYILFNVCETQYCEYYGEDEKMTFISEVGTYFAAISQYLPTKVQEYCEACEENYDYCYAMSTGQQYYPEGYEEAQEEGEDDEGEEGEDEGGEEEDGEGEEEGDGERRLAVTHKRNRRLKKNGNRKLENNQVLKFVDCQMCADYECLDFHDKTQNGYYDENGDYVEAELDDAMEWLNGFSECAQTNSYMDDYQMYSNLMCNAEGTGLEIGLFLDEDCLMYSPKLAFKDIMEDNDSTYYSMISDVVEFTFTNEGIECYDPEVVWYNEVDYYYEQMEAAENGEEEEEEEEDEEEPQAAEWCQEIVQEDAAVDIYDCSGYAAEEEEENDDDYVANYNWYTFELYANQADEIGAVCTVYNTEEQAYEGDDAYVQNGKSSGYTPHTVYNGENEGLFNYEKASEQSQGMSSGAIFAIVALVVAIVGGGAYFMMSKSGGSGDKKKPLISGEGEGTLA